MMALSAKQRARQVARASETPVVPVQAHRAPSRVWTLTVPRCPFCKEKLSPSHAAEHIEAQAHGAGRGWQWQNNWAGVYCIAIDDPSNPGALLQLIDPILTPEIEKAKSKSRWSLLFSFGR